MYFLLGMRVIYFEFRMNKYEFYIAIVILHSKFYNNLNIRITSLIWYFPPQVYVLSLFFIPTQLAKLKM